MKNWQVSIKLTKKEQQELNNYMDGFIDIVFYGEYGILEPSEKEIFRNNIIDEKHLDNLIESFDKLRSVCKNMLAIISLSYLFYSSLKL